jgi:hypothetical protein
VVVNPKYPITLTFRLLNVSISRLSKREFSHIKKGGKIMCRFIVHTMLELSGQTLLSIETSLSNLAVQKLGSMAKDIEIYWPKERLGLNAAKVTIDAEFTVGSEEGDIKPDGAKFEIFAKSLIGFLQYSFCFEKSLKKGDPVAVWVKPDQGKSVWLAEAHP